MSRRDLSEEWAWTQLEAWADGSLTGESRERMDAALAAEPRLRAAAERAVAVRRALRASPAASMPRGLRGRLLAIASQAPRARRSFFIPALASTAAAAVAVVAGVLWLRPETPPPVPEDPRVVAAKRDLETAMRYLQRSAVITQDHVTNAVGTGMRETFAASRNALARETDENGG
jgi:anti-sigma factor RsiW